MLATTDHDKSIHSTINFLLYTHCSYSVVNILSNTFQHNSVYWAAHLLSFCSCIFWSASPKRSMWKSEQETLQVDTRIHNWLFLNPKSRAFPWMAAWVLCLLYQQYRLFHTKLPALLLSSGVESGQREIPKNRYPSSVRIRICRSPLLPSSDNQTSYLAYSSDQKTYTEEIRNAYRE